MPSTTSGRKRSTMRTAARSASGTSAGSARSFHSASRPSPRTRTVSSPKPAAGTSRSSGPPMRPTSRTAPLGSSARNARATASAGYRCPPVPPPAIKRRITLTIVPQRRTRAVAGDAQQDPDRGQRRGERGAPVAEKRQGHARDRKRVGDRRHAEQRLEGHPRGDRGSERPPEPVRRTQRRAITADAEPQEAEHHQRRPAQTGLLADDGEDEVGVRLREPAVLLDRVSDADAEDAP